MDTSPAQHTPVRAHTAIARVPLVPEIALHLITPECPLWRASEAEAAAAGFVEPWWAFAWPGGQALARHLLDRPELVRGKRVLDFGAGCAIEGIAALRAGASSVVAADVDPLASIAAALNAALNSVSLQTTTADLVGAPVDCDVVLAGDVFYDVELAGRASSWLRSLGVPVLIGDPARGFLDTKDLVPLATYSAGADGSFDVVRATTVWTFRLAS